jgi:hypothetical protein
MVLDPQVKHRVIDRCVGQLGRTSRVWYSYGSMEIGSIVFNVVPLTRAECSEF